MVVNITNITSISSFYDLAVYGSNSTGGLLFGLFLTALFIIIVMNQNERGIDKAVASASFACLMLSLFLLPIGLMSLIFPVAFGLILAGTLMYIKFTAE